MKQKFPCNEMSSECKYNFDLHSNQHVIIEASAGTGKTYTIENIIPQFIENNISIESIAVLTFTEKAAAELQDRIRKKLLNSLLSSQTNSKLFENAIESFPNANIGTIHQFCRSILKKFSSELGLSSNFTEIKDTTTEIETYFKKFWGKIEKDDSEELIQLLQIIDYSVFKDIIIRIAVNTSGQIVAPLKDFFNEDLCKSVFAKIKNLIQKVPFEKKMPDYKVRLKSLLDLNESLPNLEIIVAYEQAFLKDDHNPNTNVKKFLLKETSISESEYDSLMDSLSTHICNFKQKEYLPFLNQILNLTNQFISEYKDYLQSKDKIQLDDLIFQTRRLILEFPEIQKQLQKTYRYLILDECQDTNPIQIDLILELFKNKNAGIILVGDPKQSIYRFRNADLDSYQDSIKKLNTQDYIQLDTSFRSSERLIQAFNFIFPHFANLQNIYKPVKASRSLDPIAKELKPPILFLGLDENNIPRTTDKSGEKFSADSLREDSLREIIQAIKTITHNENYKIQIKNTNDYRTIEYSDIAVLAKTNEDLNNILQEFSKHSISANIYKSVFFYSHKIVQAISHLLHAIENPNDTSSIYKALASDLFLIPERTLFLLSERKELNYLIPTSFPEIEEIYKTLRKAHEYRYTQDIALTLHNLLTENRILEFISMGFDGKRNLANIYHLLEILSYSQLTENMSFGEIVRNFKKDVEKATDQEIKLDNDKKDFSFNSVQLMTYHASKGLEFPVCILYNLAGGSNPKNKTTIYLRDKTLKQNPIGVELQIKNKHGKKWNSPAFDTFENNDEQSLLEEKDRVLYVAFTRAKDYLILPLHLPAPSDSFRNRISSAFSNENINSLIQLKLAENFHYPLESTKKDVNISSQDSSTETINKQIRKIDLTPNEIYSKSGIRLQSYSSLAKHLESEEESAKEKVASEKKSYLESEESSPLAISSEKRGTTFGLLCHAVMENFDLSLLSDSLATRQAVTEMVNQYYPSTGLMETKDYTSQEAIEYCYSTLTKSYPMNLEKTEFAFIKDWQHLKRERSFYYKLKSAKMDYLIGIGDGLFLWKNKYYLLDWKTNLIHTEDKTIDEVIQEKVEHSYRYQYMIYSMNLLDNIAYKSLDQEKFWEENFGGMLFIFMRVTEDKKGSLLVKPSFGELQKFKKELEELK
ncbi:MAG TPA: UvrD-helicase domain-containing protein [Leptospiraceae bacterium]|nr:UvrD-helicase domain-containing protein [Leptospiraceae bacterium]HMX33147.1 UvrD-helicase domain-containing protein [Leptospiraceae bacterium]HMY29908.1 UvrD-helicase domain-containing protein [Leptospiraceae bacterium]HMZ62948.1 UvrD-helicase domain-containing protein [Leptospiraceae bacterium]HNA08276.1 UvrD-helicase domain-containing protein [Leptospiraceae bacterium]